MGRVEGKVAVVTGAGSGIGAATAKVLGSEGARVACADIDVARAEATAKEIGAAGGEAAAFLLDVTDPSSNDDAAAAIVDHFGGMHIAHLNAGIGTMGAVLDITLDDWDRTMAVNLRGVMLGMQSFGRAIRDTVNGVAGGGAIIVTSSGAGLNGGAAMGTYCATKFAVIGLVKCAAIDLAPAGIR